MTTSGTIGGTTINVTRLIEKALRRCGLSPTSNTQETMETAREDLFMLLMSLSNRGLNLWCIDRQEIPLVEGQATYVLPVGTLEVLNLNLATVTDEELGTVRELVLMPINRDDYTALPNKQMASSTPTTFWFEKLREPQITLWPVPTDDTRYLVLYRYRQIQDIGDFTNEIEIPTRWLEAICWHLALRLAFELPNVTAERLTLIQQMAQSMTLEVEGGENDSMPLYITPQVIQYTR